jgi:hypothetical protein
MKIDFVRTGGFAGLRLALTLDTAGLPADEAARIRLLVQESGYFELDGGFPPAAPAPDRFEYRLAIESRTRGRHAVILPESSVTDRMRPLLNKLTALAMQRRPYGGAGGSAPQTTD